MPFSIRLHEHGGPEALVYEEVETPSPAAGEVLVKQYAIGVNYIDVYHRTGLYKLPNLPATIGSEGAGEVVAVGPGTGRLKVGDRVAYAGPLGAYAELRVVPEDRLVKLPDSIDYELAASMLLRGMTVRCLLRQVYRVDSSTTLLFHAAAGGVGLIACQWAHALGATMIGTVSSDEKGELARQNGCTHVINTSREDFVGRVRSLTGGKGCDVVYDSIGKDTFPRSLDCLRPRGLWVSFGNSSGPVPPFELTALKGSLFATRPSILAYTATTQDLEESANDLFEMVLSKKIRITSNHRYPLARASDAHRDLEARKTTGSVILVP
ncbi:quinone oxidoreductase [Hyphomicrobium sp.]|uniref:quinone oxidoreductase family protein n=1 Tax=Hyphomicrobium sp. TaxID=82 RepID=UPI000FB360A3|nr:quinone oxidoreductase [Hyphomicrobium sp.]RUO99321.1 MAG: quinone oxidoreductase [Hyphomicrobium sp.]